MRRLVAVVATASLVLSVVVGGTADGQEAAQEGAEASQVPLDSRLQGARGPQRVVAHLRSEAVVRFSGRGSDAQRAQAREVGAEQEAFIERARQLDPEMEPIGRLDAVLNAVILRVDAGRLERLAADPDVTWIAPVVDYQLDLAETVGYVGATALRQFGVTGEGVRVAVVDSGIDYTHAALGGDGTSAAYEAAYGLSFDDAAQALEDSLVPGTVTAHTVVEPATFPTAKVVGGYDFIGDRWTGGEESGPEQPDPDPIDIDGHGTHVADIIAGVARDTDADGDIDAEGVAPEALLYAYKVCSSFERSCSGVGLLQALDAAVDPDGDGDTSDHAEVANLSLGLAYGNARDDSLSEAVENMTAIGTLVVGAAGNSFDHPYSTGTPAATPGALSVAWTHVPSARLQYLRLDGPTADRDRIVSVIQPWSAPLRRTVAGPVQYGDGAGGNLDGCAPFTPRSLGGRIALVDRGNCEVSAKVDAIARGGGIAALVGLVAPGEPFAFLRGAGERAGDIPALAISQADSDLVKQQVGEGYTNATLDPANSLALVGSVVSDSSRGPSIDGGVVKPEIGAPGASVSAIAATGNGYAPFGGTSGAAPMVTGAAALLASSDRYRGQPPKTLKAALMNTAETRILADAATGTPAPVTRIGGGELRVDRALASPAVAFDDASPGVALSFGFIDASTPTTTRTRTVTVRNLSAAPLAYDIQANPRRTRNGAVTVTPSVSRLEIAASSAATFDVTLTIDAPGLRPWRLNSGAQGANGGLLTEFEYDGHVQLTDPAGAHPPLRVPFHVLPRAAADVTARGSDEGITLANDGAATATIDAYTLIGTSPAQPRQDRTGRDRAHIDLRALGVATAPSEADDCGGFAMRFAIATHTRLAHVNAPITFTLLIDTDQDGQPDYRAFTFDRSLDPAQSLSDGRNAVFVTDLDNPDQPPATRRFTDHALHSPNLVMEVCADQIGLTQTDLGNPITVSLRAIDFRAQADLTPGQAVTDQIGPIEIRPGAERYTAAPLDLPPGQTAPLTVTDRGPNASTASRPDPPAPAGATNPTTGQGLLLLLDAFRPQGRGGTPEGRAWILIRL